MHILYTTPAFPPFHGGGERYVHSLALTLAQMGHRVTAVTSTAATIEAYWQGQNATPQTLEIAPGLTVIRNPITPFPGGRQTLMLWRKLMALISSLPGDQTAVLRPMARYFPRIKNLDVLLNTHLQAVDVVHGFNTAWETPLLAAWQQARQRQIPFVATPFVHAGSGTDRRHRHLNLMDHHAHILNRSNRVLTLTSVGKDHLVRHDLSPQKVGVIGSGLDPMPEPAPRAATLAKFDLKSPYAIFIGPNSYDKGAIHAAQATLRLRQRGLDTALVLVGARDPAFDRFYRRLSADARWWIRPFGILPDADKNTLLAASQFLLLPSRMDSFGIVLLEAWAYGKPVIGARSGGIPGVIRDGIDGLLVPFGDVDGLADAAQTLWQDENLRRQMGQQGQQKTAVEYTWPQVAGRVLGHYQDVMRQSTLHLDK